MSSSKKPDISKIKKRISDPDSEPAPEPAADKPRMKPETMKQIQDYARDVEEMRKEEEKEKEVNRVEIDKLPEDYVPQPGDGDDPVYYRNTPSDNPEIRKEIESRCREMDFSDLVLTGRVHQTVPILSDKLSVRYKSLLASENFWIERRAEGEASTDWGIRSWMGYARLALSIEAINDNGFDPYVIKDDEIDNDLFNKKFKKIMNMGEKLVELLLIHLNWFNDRVDRLYSDDFEKLKNG
ncbi:MAG: hypothetical protein CL582_16745 [Alteromonadaceae bacterium]|nr:hypothetical protein [Alteromonadaceae bacterium]|tara:strand:- start:3228 stop:3944 length:717 start_codon:yes stop_codon:yes gene_type:complete